MNSKPKHKLMNDQPLIWPIPPLSATMVLQSWKYSKYLLLHIALTVSKVLLVQKNTLKKYGKTTLFH